MVNLMLENKSPLNATDVSGLTALHHGKFIARFNFFLVYFFCVLCGWEGLWVNDLETDDLKAIAEGHGDTAMVLLKAGAETDKKDVDGNLAIDLAPDRKVR